VTASRRPIYFAHRAAYRAAAFLIALSRNLAARKDVVWRDRL
jgi:hypothetical protein